MIVDPFHKVYSPESFGVNTIVHGDRTLVVVEQGHIGFVLERGQPVLLPPGMHQWKSPTMVYQRAFDLNNNVIRMGPLTLVTVDEGYSAVTEDNGKQVILDGGETYLLTHRNWKFQKYISQKIQSDSMQRIEATSADNVLMAVDATVIWRIKDVAVAGINSVETISTRGEDGVRQAAGVARQISRSNSSSSANAGKAAKAAAAKSASSRAEPTQPTGQAVQSKLGDIAKLKNDVLKQAEASLAAFIGAVQYSDTFNVAAAVQTASQSLPVAAGEAPGQYSSPLFDLARLQTCVDHANAITSTYGVHIISINVVAAVPADRQLQSSLAQGAVAAAEAQKFETVARGHAEAKKVEALGDAEATITRAKGDAEAEKIRADGARQAADMLADSETAVRFAMIDKTGHALADKSAFFFGATPGKMDNLLAPAVIAAATGQSVK
jgi:regulator of protease activity HflC (stomatin/prohibitin superfamily)